MKATFRKTFKRTLILSGGYDAARAESRSQGRQGRPDRRRASRSSPIRIWSRAGRPALPLNAPDMNTFYTPGAKGYTDYPTLVTEQAAE